MKSGMTNKELLEYINYLLKHAIEVNDSEQVSRLHLLKVYVQKDYILELERMLINRAS